MRKILNGIMQIINSNIIIVILILGLFSLLFDGPRYMKRGYIREFRIIKVISFSYIAIAGLMCILLLIR